jgi:hypothetical protein
MQAIQAEGQSSNLAGHVVKTAHRTGSAMTVGMCSPAISADKMDAQAAFESRLDW